MVTHRIFLCNLDESKGHDRLREELTQVFAPFGNGVQEIFLPDRSDKSYAVVNMNSVEGAAEALKAVVTPHALFEIMTVGRDRRPVVTKEKNRKRRQAWQESYDSILTMTRSSNLLCQVHTSHEKRFADIINARTGSSVIGTFPGLAKTVSVLFVKASDPASFRGWLCSLWYVSQDVQRVYAPTMVAPGNFNDMLSFVVELCGSQLPDKSRLRLQMFPPKLTGRFLQNMEERESSAAANNNVQDVDPLMNRFMHKEITFSPQNPTNTLEIIQLVNDQAKGPSRNWYDLPANGLFAVGLHNTMYPTTVPTPPQRNSPSTEPSICRAYWKLREAFCRYSGPLPTPKSATTALDCGAAPGGWTQFLAQEFPTCRVVYSVDPAELHPSILELPSTKHIRATIEKAMPLLQEKALAKQLDIWVSDMCVKDIEQQVDWLLQARSLGVVGDGTFYVLTLKCTWAILSLRTRKPSQGK